MGDLEGLPFGACSAIGFGERALDRTSIRYESVFGGIFALTPPPVLFDQMLQISKLPSQTQGVLFMSCIRE